MAEAEIAKPLLAWSKKSGYVLQLKSATQGKVKCILQLVSKKLLVYARARFCLFADGMNANARSL